MSKTKNPKLADYTPHDGISAEADDHIRCPYCGEDSFVEPGESDPDLITFWGKDERIEFECPDCEQIFYVKETVTRSYAAFKSEAPQ